VSTILLLAALAASGTPAVTPTAPSVPALVNEVLADKHYEFCHDPHFPLTTDEARLCPLIVTSSSACPAFVEACKAGPNATRVPPPRHFNLGLPDLGALPRLLLLAVLAVAIGGVLFLVLRNVRAWQRRPAEPEETGEAAAAVEVETAQLVESDVERLLARARAAAAGGDYARAIMDLHAALLRRLEGAGILTVHPSRTNGDYVRAVASARPSLVTPVRSFVIDVERVLYGSAAATASLFQDLLGRLQQVSVDKLMALALVLALVAGATACSSDRGGWEYSPSGRAGVIALLQRAGRQVHERLAPVVKLKDDELDAMVLLPDAELSPEDWKALEGWVAGGGHLVLAGMPARPPKWIEIREGAELPGRIVGSDWFSKEHGALQVSLPASKTLSIEAAHRPVLLRKDGKSTGLYAAERPHDEGRITYLADDRLFTNGALPLGDNARAVVLLLADTPRIELVGELAGWVSPNPVASVVRGRLAPFLVQLLAVAALFYLLRGVAFGRLREPPAVQRRSFIEHVEAVGEQYARARAARHVLASYGHWVIERLRERLALPAGSGLIALADAVALRTGRSAGEVMRLFMEARESGGTGPDSAEEAAAHLQAVRALGQLLSWGSKAGNQGRTS
jgi:hypothetical protein